MINAVYELQSPRMFDVTYKELNIDDGSVLIRPVFLSICKADQRYYQGMRSADVLREKLPMALIHECVGKVILDKTGTFKTGEIVVPVPTIPEENDDVVSENYLRSSKFCSSGHDGFLRDYIIMTPDRLIRSPDEISLEVASFTELVSVSTHAVSRFEKSAHKRRDVIGVWGDGNVGFITALVLRYMYPDSKIYIFGTVEEKLSYFSFADETYNVDRLPDDISVDHAFECVGGYGSQPAINQIIDIINPEGSIALMGVSENNVALNTRMILEKGIRLFGSSRSSADDFQKAVDLMSEHKELVRYFEYLVDGIVTVNSIVDLHKAFDVDFKRNFGKTVLKWEI